MNPDEHSTCRYLLGYLSDYIDGDLDKEFCKEIEEHISECENCRVVVDTLQKTILLYHESAEESLEIPAETRNRLFKTLNLEDYLKQ